MAEELSLGADHHGAGNDIERATDLARRMVCEWGMSEEVGPMTFGKKDEEIFLGRDFTQKEGYSKNTAIEIDAEVRRIIQESYQRAKDLLKTISVCSTKLPRICSRKRSSTVRSSMPS